MLLCCIPCFLLIILIFIRGLTRRISTNPCLFLIYQLNIFRFSFAFVNYTVIYKTKVERKDIELVDEEEAQIGADCSSATSNKYEIYKEEARNAAHKHKPKRVESVNADVEAFGFGEEEGLLQVLSSTTSATTTNNVSEINVHEAKVNKGCSGSCVDMQMEKASLSPRGAVEEQKEEVIEVA
ncbi:hypothetical protein JHK82_034986 [Glycine max]|nr:hypothetical protein JHK82_034986 [Glycine max]